MNQRRQFGRLVLHSLILASCGSAATTTTTTTDTNTDTTTNTATNTTTPLKSVAANDTTAVDVLIIGAGMAGVAAAATLQAAGKTVRILEARDRIGGRMWSWRKWGAPVELGANWIETAKGNPLVKLAKEAGVATHADPEEAEELFIDTVAGRPLSESEAEGLYDQIESMLDALIEAAEERDIDQDASLRDGLNALPAYKKLNDNRRRLIESVLTQVVSDEFGAEADKLSWTGYDAGEAAYSGGNQFVIGGYDGIPTMLAGDTPIEYETIVDTISWNNNGVQVSAGERVWEADAVIVTVPLGVLKAQSIAFEPALPAKYTNALEQLEMGLLDRCVMKFDEVFWDTEYTTFSVAGPDPTAWYQFIPLNGPLGIPALAAFNSGSKAWDLETKSDDEIKAEMLAVIKAAFDAEPTVVDMVITRWGQDPFARGAYSYVPAGGAATARNVLANPISDQLYLAGEAYTDTDPSSVHGAYNSGIATAKQVLERL
jgi:monoamine oxidase